MENSNGKSGLNTQTIMVNENLNRFCLEVFSLLGSDVPKPDYGVFVKAFTGFLDLKAGNYLSKNMLTIIDFSISSKFERMWIIDLNTMKIVHQSLVAHGHNSGDEFACHFSNSPSSHESSLGFYVTGGICYGIHGMSLILEGMEPGINDNAREREIVIHGADYVSNDFVRQYGRLGRSFGCPSIPLEDHEKIIKMLAGGSCLFIYYPDENYLRSSKLFERAPAENGMNKLINESKVVNSLSDPCSVVSEATDTFFK
jgi:hypothetical protein